ncbi:MAG: Crp/Fnr family transcriptional regulator [Bacteroidota bacterium]
MEKLSKFLNQFAHIPDQDLSALILQAQTRLFEKGELFIEAGNRANQLGFILSGVMRVYEIKDGREVTNYFNSTDRNPIVTSFKSYLTDTCSTEYVEAIENAEMLIITKANLERIFESSPVFERLGRKLAEYNYLQAMTRIDSLQVASAGSRYESFLKMYPGLINRIPHHYIASWLGITPESLSRIRKGSW